MSSSTTRRLPLVRQFAVAYYNRGIFYFDKGDYANAIADYNQTIAIAPKYAEEQQPRQYLREDGRYGSRADGLGEAITLNPSNTAAYKTRADVYAKRGDFDRAIADYDRVIEINPLLMPAYVGRSIAYFKNHKFASGFFEHHPGGHGGPTRCPRGSLARNGRTHCAQLQASIGLNSLGLLMTQTGQSAQSLSRTNCDPFCSAARLCFPVCKAHSPYRGIWGDPNSSRFCGMTLRGPS